MSKQHHQCINPHCKGGTKSKINPFLVDHLEKVAEGTEYKDYPSKIYQTAANGQLKLFASTLDFLTGATVPDVKYLVVYPGSAPGDNISAMIKLFPNVSWYLVDPREFYAELYDSKNVEHIESDFFMDRHIDDVRDKVGSRQLLLISDIRNMEDTDFVSRENNIAVDMRLQESWVKKLNPRYAQLKFRLPRTYEKFDYLAGFLALQSFAPHVSAETRLICAGDASSITYDVKKYDNIMHYFNQTVRPNIFRKTNPGSFLDGCYDCTAFVKLTTLYNELHNTKITPEFLLAMVPAAWNKHKSKMKAIRKKHCSQNVKANKGASAAKTTNTTG
jgi:hypothetical protein